VMDSLVGYLKIKENLAGGLGLGHNTLH